MRRLFLVGLLLVTGCQGFVGPLQRRCSPVWIDNPCLPPDEQQMRRREGLALPEASPAVGPRTYAEEPALRGP